MIWNKIDLSFFQAPDIGTGKMYYISAMFKFCNDKGPSGIIYRALFEPYIVYTFLNAYQGCVKYPAEKMQLEETRKTFNGCQFGLHGGSFFPKPILYILDKAIQQKFDQKWQRASTEEFESGEYSYLVENLKLLVEEELKFYEQALLLKNKLKNGHGPAIIDSPMIGMDPLVKRLNKRTTTWVTDGNPDDYDVDKVLQDLVSEKT